MTRPDKDQANDSAGEAAASGGSGRRTRTGYQKKPGLALWKKIAMVAVGAVIAVTVVYVMKESVRGRKVYPVAKKGGELNGHPTADLVKRFGEPDTVEKGVEDLTGPQSEEDIEIWSYDMTEVWVYQGKIVEATDKDDRLRMAETKTRLKRGR